MYFMFRKCLPLMLVIALILAGSSCKRGVNVFTVVQDIELGKQVSKQIESDTKQFPILAERGNEQIYNYIRKITGKILNSGEVEYRDRFAWQVKIIDDSETLNAFATPGGYIYVYTGLIKFLDSEDQLAGVMGHEIAHADRRHSTRQLTTQYGLQTLINAALGQESALGQVAGGLIGLKFGRKHEAESDEYSVIYMCNTDYNAAGAAEFFRKIQSQEGRPPEFLSTHPDPNNRVQEILKKKAELGCKGNKTYKREYERIKELIK